MPVSSFAGKPVEPSMLVNVPRLITAYYTEVPDPSVPAQRVAFGTSGHRGSSFATGISMNGISSRSARRSACTGSKSRSTARCFSAWTLMRFRCRHWPARLRCWPQTGLKS